MSRIKVHDMTSFPVPAHLALLQDFDSDDTTIERDIEQKLVKLTTNNNNKSSILTETSHFKSHLIQNPRDAFNDEDILKDMKLTKLLQPDRIPNKNKYLKHYVLICLVHLLSLSSYYGLQSFFFTFYNEIGLYALSLHYSWYALTTLMIANTINSKLGPRMTIILGIVCQALFLLSNSINCNISVLLGSGLAGFGSALMTVAVRTYEISLSVMYASVSDSVNLQQVWRLFSMVTIIFRQGSVVLGNLLMSVVLVHLTECINSTFQEPFSRRLIWPVSLNTSTRTCGLQCQQWRLPTESVLYIIYGLYAALLIVASFLFICCTSKLDIICRSKSAGRVCQPAILGTFILLVERKLLLTLGTVIYVAYVKALLLADLLKYYISCNLGLEYLGYVMVGYSVMNGVVSVSIYWLSRFFNRIIINLAGFMVSCIVLMFLYAWNPASRSDMAYLLLLAAMGAGDGLLNTQIEATISFIGGNQGDHVTTLTRAIQSGTTAMVLCAGMLLCPGTKLLLAIGLLGLALGTSLAMEGVRGRRIAIRKSSARV